MRRIGIIQAITDFDDSALRYIILAINSFQTSFQLEFVPFDPQDKFLASFLAKDPVEKPGHDDMMSFYDRQRDYFNSVAHSYDQRDEAPDCFQIVSISRFKDDYFWWSNRYVSIMAMGNWKRSLSPPSILEFIQVLVLEGALIALCPRLETHLGTRGCIMDFSFELYDARQKVLSGYICQSCRSIIAECGYPELADELHPLLSRSWLGKSGDPSSPASIVSKLGHDLFITKGLKPNMIESARMGLLEEGAKQISVIIGTIIAAFVLALLGYAVVSVQVNSSSGNHPSQTQSSSSSPHASSSPTSRITP